MGFMFLFFCGAMMMEKPRFLIRRPDENTIISESPLETYCLYRIIIGIPACYTLRMFHLLTKILVISLVP